VFQIQIFGVWLSPVERLVRDDLETAFLVQNQQKPYKFFSQIVNF
jgi:hypothetical protein